MTSKVMRLTPISASAENSATTAHASPAQSRAHHPPSVVVENLVSEGFDDSVPVAGREVRLEALIRLGPQRFPAVVSAG